MLFTISNNVKNVTNYRGHTVEHIALSCHIATVSLSVSRRWVHGS